MESEGEVRKYHPTCHVLPFFLVLRAKISCQELQQLTNDTDVNAQSERAVRVACINRKRIFRLHEMMTKQIPSRNLSQPLSAHEEHLGRQNIFTMSFKIIWPLKSLL